MAELRGNSVDWSSRVTSLNAPGADYYRCGCILPDPLYVVWLARYTGRRLDGHYCEKHQERPHAPHAEAKAG